MKGIIDMPIWCFVLICALAALAMAVIGSLVIEGAIKIIT